MRRRLAMTLLLAAPVGAAIAPVVVSATEGRSDTTLSVVSGPGYMPIADGPKGVATEIVRAVFARMGTPIDLRMLPWARGLALVSEGALDATYPYMITPERQRTLVFSQPLVQLRLMVFQSVERPFPVGHIDDLSGKLMCSPLGHGLPVEVLALAEAGRLARHSPPMGLAQCVSLVHHGRAHFFIEDEMVGAAAVREAGLAGSVVPVGAPVATPTLHLVVGKVRPGAGDLIDRFDRSLATLREDGTVAALQRRYAPVSE